jgi:hypothetical protein
MRAKSQKKIQDIKKKSPKAAKNPKYSKKSFGHFGSDSTGHCTVFWLLPTCEK